MAPLVGSMATTVSRDRWRSATPSALVSIASSSRVCSTSRPATEAIDDTARWRVLLVPAMSGADAGS